MANAPYMNKRQLLEALREGYLEDVRKQVLTYGTINDIKDWVTKDGYHAGCHRKTQTTHHGIQWVLHMHNGDIVSVTRAHGDHKLFEVKV